MQGGKLFRLTLAVALLLLALACGSSSASAATGGTTAPSGTSGSGSSGGSSSGGTAPTSGTKSPSTSTSPSRTGGVSPSAVRPPTAPVKPKPKKPKKKKHKKRKRHPAQPPAPPTTTPDPPPPGPGVADIPAPYLAIYKAAGATYGVDWRVLAAIGKNESDHGRSTAAGVTSGRNYAGCCSGPMQICTVQSCSNTWGYYAIDANGDGVASVYDPDDAIYAAAALVRDLKPIVGNDPKLLLAAYNAGPGNVKKYNGVPPFPETQAYVKAGIAYINSLR